MLTHSAPYQDYQQDGVVTYLSMYYAALISFMNWDFGLKSQKEER